MLGPTASPEQAHRKTAPRQSEVLRGLGRHHLTGGCAWRGFLGLAQEDLDTCAGPRHSPRRRPEAACCRRGNGLQPGRNRLGSLSLAQVLSAVEAVERDRTHPLVAGEPHK